MVKQKLQWVRRYEPIALGLVSLLHPLCEVVAHDIQSDTIVGIWGASSGRSVGDPSLLEELTGYSGNDQVIGPYEKVTLDGRRLTSISIVIRDDDGAIQGLLCINIDRSPFDKMAEVALTFLKATGDRPPELFERDWREQIALSIDEFCKSRQLQRHRMSKTQRAELVRTLDVAGLFATRNAANHVAESLGVSRATVYSLLKETRSDSH